jgi:predicted Rossmann-fold nucleotide-binding protein
MHPQFIYNRDLSKHAVQLEILEENGHLKYFTFFGCELGESRDVVMAECTVMTKFRLSAPFEAYRETLYTVEELYRGLKMEDPLTTYPTTKDAIIYQHFVASAARDHDFNESLARRLHDACITEAMNTLFSGGKHICAIMGGHKLARGSKQYRDAAKIARMLTDAGILVCSGGGPGAMEACNLGVWFSNRPEEEMEKAIDMLSQVPFFSDPHWLSTACDVRRKYPLIQPTDGKPKIVSLGIPTFFYGHEPPNMFQTHVAKFFANSVREDALLSIAFSGIIYFPGSAGTVQEMFQDACQNHYEVFGFASPMVFMDSRFWTEDLPAYDLLKSLAKGKPYNSIIHIHDEPEDAVRSILDFHLLKKPLLRRLSSAPGKYPVCEKCSDSQAKGSVVVTMQPESKA